MAENDSEPVPTGIRFQDTRFDPDVTPLHAVANEMAALFGYSAQGGIPVPA